MSLRIVVVTQDDPFYVPLFFERFLADLPEAVSVRSIVCLNSFNESLPELIQRMYRLYGLRNFLRRGVEFAARTTADRIGFGNHSVASVAEENGIATQTADSVNTDEFVAMLEREEIDVVLSVSAPEIFDERVLSAPNWGCLNVHTAELPKYRGMLPTFWALYHGEDRIGVTVHTMADEVDCGEIARQTTFRVSPENTLDDVIKRGKRVGGTLAAEVLAEVVEGTVTLSPMDGEESYFSFPTQQERRKLQRQGRKLL
jgi:methionyl-tRNA formyltransferase